MRETPTVLELPAQPYVAVRGLVTMETFPAIADRFGEVFGFLADRSLSPAGAPFFRYLTVDMERELEVEAAVPVAGPVEVDGEVLVGELPAGRYATLVHVGHPGGLVKRTAEMLAWADEHGLVWDVTDTPRGQRWGARLERLLTNPAEEPDMNCWRTELALRLR